MSYQGVRSDKWITPGRGLVQGCPLSPVLSATFLFVWACTVKRTGVDDRYMWTLSAQHASDHEFRVLLDATNSIRLVPLCAGLINARLLGPPAWMLAGRAKPLGTRLIAALRP